MLKTAQETHDQTITHNNERVKKLMKKVEDEINEACKKGQFQVSIPLRGFRPADARQLVKYLTKLFYTASLASNSKSINISWEQAEQAGV